MDVHVADQGCEYLDVIALLQSRGIAWRPSQPSVFAAREPEMSRISTGQVRFRALFLQQAKDFGRCSYCLRDVFVSVCCAHKAGLVQCWGHVCAAL